MEPPSNADLCVEVMKAIRKVADEQHLQGTDITERSVRLLVDATMRVVFAMARAADAKATGVLAHLAADGKVVVSVRRGKNEWQEVVIDDEEKTSQ